MLIEPAPELRNAMLELLKKEYQLEQQREGLHLSSLIYCLTKSYWDKHEPLPPTDKEVQLWSIGFALERVMISKLHVDELTIDGIKMNPDFRLILPADLKSTRMSPNGRKDSDGFQFPDGWRKQFAAYRYGLNQVIEPFPRLDFGVIVMHLIQPEITAWKAWFTQSELEANWTWVLERADTFESMDAAQDPQPFEHNESWECENCRYVLMCCLEASLKGKVMVSDSDG